MNVALVTDQKRLEQELAGIYTTSPIEKLSQFAGRKEVLGYCQQKLKAGTIAFVVVGEPGVGKSSFARVLLSDRTSAPPFVFTASTTTDFAGIFLNVLTKVGEQFNDAEREMLVKSGYKVGGEAIGFAGERQSTSTLKAVAEQKLDLNFVLDRLKKREADIRVIIIDDFHRVAGPNVKTEVLEVVKGLSDRDSDLVIAIAANAKSDRDIFGSAEYEAYLERHIASVRLPRMNRDELQEILEQRRQVIDFESQVQEQVAWIAAGYPARVHQLAGAATLHWLGTSVANTVKRLARKLGIFQRFFRGDDDKPVAIADVGVRLGSKDLDFAVKNLLVGYVNDRPASASAINATQDRPDCGAVLTAIARSDDDEFAAEWLSKESGLSASDLATAIEPLLGEVIVQETDSAGRIMYRLTSGHIRVYLRSLTYVSSRMTSPPL